MSLIKALRLVAGYVSLPESARADLEATLAELETPEPAPVEEVSPAPAAAVDAPSSEAAPVEEALPAPAASPAPVETPSIEAAPEVLEEPTS